MIVGEMQACIEITFFLGQCEFVYDRFLPASLHVQGRNWFVTVCERQRISKYVCLCISVLYKTCS